MPLQLRPLHKHFAAEASGLDLRQPLSREEVLQVVRALDQYAVLVWHDQPMTQAQQVAMAEQFGPLNPGLKKIGLRAQRLADHALIDISNIDAEGKPLPRDDSKVVSSLANQLWHSDSSFQAPAVSYSMLSAVTLPSWGGETEYADLRAAWDALPQRLKDKVRPLVAEHFALHSRITLLGDASYSPEQIAALPAVTWPLHRIHPGSGREVLFCGIHCRRILGMGVSEGKMLLLDLLEHATQPEFRYRHEWAPGDLVMWDNRSTLHRGRAYDLDEPRELRRTTNDEIAAFARAVA